MVRYEGIAVIEKMYPYEKAKSADEYINGIFGTVKDGVFTKGAGFECIMVSTEKGDDAFSDRFIIHKDEQTRVADLKQTDGEILNITSDNIVGNISKGNKLVANTNGLLAVNASPTDNYLLVEEVTRYGCRARIIIKK